MKYLILLPLLVSCGVDHTIYGDVEHKASGEASIDWVSTTCDDERFTPEQKLACIKAITSATIRVKGTDVDMDDAVLEEK